MATVEHLETWLENFTESAKSAAGRNLPWLRRLREDAFARFCEVGFPTTHDEDWRFTNVSAIARTAFQTSSDVRLAKGDTAAWRVDDVAAMLVFVNGRFSAELSEVNALPKGVTVASLAWGSMPIHSGIRLLRSTRRSSAMAPMCICRGA
jgi:Fe-S cluster assembly protein SufD